MSKDKDLESIKAGKGLTDSSISPSDNNQKSGTTTEQRGVRKDTFSRQEGYKSGK